MIDTIKFFVWWFLLNAMVGVYMPAPTPLYWVIFIITGVIAFVMIYDD
jgi:lipopolysaccharide export LptBFGC system permease protein LptF